MSTVRSGSKNDDAVVVGPLFLDVVMGPLERLPVPGEELWCDDCELLAGGAANQAAALAKLGVAVDLCSFIGQDLAGKVVAELLEDSGISTRALVPRPRQSVTAALGVGGDRAMVTSGTDQAPPLSGDAPGLLMGDLRALLANLDLIREWKAQGTLVIGDVGWDASGEWDQDVLRALEVVDVFVPNEEEARAYTGKSTVQAAARSLAASVPNVVVTRGAAGAVVAGEEEFEVPAVAAQFRDATGAGDVFSAGLGWALLQGHEMRTAVGMAMAAGAISTESMGSAGAPTVEQLLRRLGG